MLSFVVLASVVLSQCTPQNTEKMKEWRDLSVVERHNYVKAIACLSYTPSRLPHKLLTAYAKHRLDDFSLVNADFYGGRSDDTQNTPASLPWNRVLLRLYDHALRNECGYQGPMPYWDLSIGGLETKEIWQYFSANMEGVVMNPLLLTVYNSKTTNPMDAKFAPRVNRMTTAVPDAHLVSRGRMTAVDNALDLFSRDRINQGLALKDYPSFRRWLELALATLFQRTTGGDLRDPISAANDPLFYLLRRNADRLWYKWQQTNPLIAMSYGASLQDVPTQATDKLFFRGLSFVTLNPKLTVVKGHYLHDEYPVQFALNPKGGAFNGLMCYEYQDPTQKWPPMK